MKNVKEIKIEVKGKEWQDALDKAFTKKKKDIKVDGFRKGACPKDVYIKKVGIEALFMDACDIAIEDAYKKAFDDADMEIVCEPNVSIESVTKEAAVFVFTMIGRPEITLGDYKKLGVKKEKVKVTDEEIEHEIEHIKEHMAEIVNKKDGTVVEGNTAVIDFDGVVDGKPLDGGSGKNYSLEIGSHSFIPGFEEGVVGMKVDETKELKLTFPEDYTPELKGKDVTFTVTVREIKERIKPEINKDFFDDLGIEGVDSIEKLKEHVEEEMMHQKEHQAEDKFIDELLHKATDNMKVDINNEIIDSEVKRMLNQYRQELQMQGVTLEQYLSFTGTKMEDVENMMKPQAIARIKTRYLLEEIVKKEKIKVTDEEIKEEIKKASEQYEMKEDEFLSAIGGEEMIKYDLEMRKAIEIVKEG
ncbi:MAG: trigger factor [Bacilli bacterium]|nr:trigger factor [Bacilli bacterium]